MKLGTVVLICVVGVMPGYNLFLYAMHGYVYACGKAGCWEVSEGPKLWISLTFYAVIFLAFLGGAIYELKLKSKSNGLSP